MIHIRIDDCELNSERKFACGLGPALPDGDKWFYAGESGARLSDCPGCNPHGPHQLGTPASAMNGNAMARFSDPAAWDSWIDFCERNGMP